MNKMFFLILILSFLAVGTVVLAQETNLTATSGVSFDSAQDKKLPAENKAEMLDVGLTPDSSFYFLKTWKESIQTFFTFGAENKARQFLHLADVRLAEYKKMVEKGILRQAQDKKLEIAEKTLEKYENQLNYSLEKAVKVKEKGGDVKKLTETINEKIIGHQKVLAEVLNKIPNEAKKGIENAIEISQRILENANQQKIEEGLKQASPAVQSCIKSLISSISGKIKGGELKGTSDIQTILLNCLLPGTKIPSGGGINMELLRKMEEYYGSSLPPKDLESLKKAQEQLKGIIPQGTKIPSSQKTLNLEDVKKAQEKMQEELKKIPPEKLEYIKKMQEQQENVAPLEIPGDSSGSGMGM